MLTVVVFGQTAGASSTTPSQPDTGTEQTEVSTSQYPLPPAITQSLVAARIVEPTLAASSAAAPTLVLPAAGVAAVDIPKPVLTAYLKAQAREAALEPGCHLSWPVLAGIGLIESGHAVQHGALTAGWDGVARPPILGPVLDGNGTAAVADSDGGKLDGDRTWDRAVGPMQFLPSTWRTWGVDADGNGTADPQNVQDAAAAAAGYLCNGGADLRQPAALVAAVFSYNHSNDYVRAVLSAAQTYAKTTPNPAVAQALAELGPAPTTPPPVPTVSETPAQKASTRPVPAVTHASPQPVRAPVPAPTASPSPQPAPSSTPASTTTPTTGATLSSGPS